MYFFNAKYSVFFIRKNLIYDMANKAEVYSFWEVITVTKNILRSYDMFMVIRNILMSS